MNADGDAGMTFSVVIPAYNRASQLRTALENLSRIDYPSDRWNVIVVDDGSPEPLEPVVRSVRLPVRVQAFRQSNTGSGGARNLAAVRSGMEYLAFTADDCTPASDWLKQMAEAFRPAASRYALVGGAIRHALPNDSYATANHLLIEYLTAAMNAERPMFFTPNNLAVHRQSFLDAGGFNATIGPTGEDREFCSRWASQGRPIFSCDAAIVEHAHAQNLQGFVRQHISYGVGSARFRKLRVTDDKFKPIPEPLSFYINLVLYPFRTPIPRKVTHSALLALSQVANAYGVLRETMRKQVNS